MAGSANEDFLNRVCRQLVDLHVKSKRNCQLHEKVSKDCKQLLNPWPKKKKEPTQNAATENPEQHVESQKEDADPELRIVEEALARAQKLHLMHQKIMGTNEDGPQLNQTKNKDVSSETKVKQCETAKQPVTTKQEDSKRNHKLDSVKTTGSSVNRNVARDSGVKLGASVVSQSKFNSLIKVPKQTHIPAHAKAPFKTAPETKRVPRSAVHSSRSTTRSSVSARSFSGKSAGRSTGSTAPRSASSGSARSSSHHQTNVAGSHQAVPLSSQDWWNQNSCDEKIRENRQNATQRIDTVQDVAVVTSRVTSLRMNDNRSKVEKQNAEPEIEEEPPFCLRTDGAKLDLPVKLKKLYSTNRKLRQKAHASGLTVEISDKTRYKHSFLDNLEKHIHEDAGEQFQVSVQLASVYRHLHYQLERALRDTLPLGEGSSVEEILRLKRTGEFVRKTLADLEESFSVVSQGCASSADEMFSRVQRNLHLHRAGAATSSDTESSVSSTACPLRNSSSHVTYAKPRQMMTHSALQCQERILRLERYLQEELHTSLLEKLNSRTSITREDVDLYRAVYSLLCSGGTVFPALVEDHEVDDEQS